MSRVPPAGVARDAGENAPARVENLSELEVFAAVAARRSFSRAARERGVSASALSQTVRTLEERMGVRLLNRTSRSVAPTEAGEALLRHLRPALLDIAAALDAVNGLRGRPAGVVRVNAPVPAIELVLAPLARAFLDRCPEVSLELHCDAAKVDIVREGFDAGVRFGEDLARDMIAVPLGGPLRYLVLGAPAYLARHGRPEGPEDLPRHRCVRHRFPDGSVFPWDFERDGRAVTVVPEGPLTVNDPRVALRAGTDGIGLVRLPEGYARPAIAAGALVPVLEAWCPALPGWFLYYPGRRRVPSAFRAFLDFLAEQRAAGRRADGEGAAGS